MSHPEISESLPEVNNRVVMYTRVGCHLCASALEIVERVCGDLDVQYAVLDVDQDPALVSRYSDYVPVVEVDGVQQGFWRIDEERLRSSLA